MQLNIAKNNHHREGMIYLQTFLHRIKKPEENSLHKTEAIFFRFCPPGGNNPIHQQLVDYLAKKNLTSPG
ncbi:hypothetical protein [Klebsiella oxytoca]|uniref:Uncharacterized protein n=1 Tax=Klebsiella oxytoca TaxID=571 RepID=A0A6B8MEF8_KLEOX|nr:hypothetical protein [Klebsiella oxytoca]QGN35815.1 hypothetical protein GJ746_00095 [Klebsiella oxytoca]